MLILETLSKNIDKILRNIKESKLSCYDNLQRELSRTNVATDTEIYQRRFKGYYQMQRRSQDWYSFFFGMLEARKGDTDVVFSDILGEIYETHGRIEPSFSSKLVATIRPHKPVYDKYVQINLSLEIPKPYEPKGVRRDKFCKAYSDLEERMAALVGNDKFRALKAKFDTRFPTYLHFTDVKKLDLLLWQYRQD